MIFLLATLAQGTTTIVGPEQLSQTKPAVHAAAPKGTTTVVGSNGVVMAKPAMAQAADVEVEIARAPSNVSLPLIVETAVSTDPAGAIARCTPMGGGHTPAAFGDLACKQVQAMGRFPVVTDEYGKPMGAMRKITVSFNTAH